MRRKWLICVLLPAVTFAVYWPAIHHDFIFFDDPQFITENSQINRGLSWHSIGYAFSTPVVSNWHPVTTLSHILDCQLFGTNPGAHHLVSVAFHAVNAALLFLVLNHLTGMPWRSTAVAAFFALHPLRVESVAWVAERKDVLSGFFFFLTLLAYTSYARASKADSPPSDPGAGRARRRWYAATLCLFTLGLMSKPMLVTVPFVLLLLDYWPLGRTGVRSPTAGLKNQRTNEEQQKSRLVRATIRKSVIEKIPFFGLSAVACVLTLLFQQGTVAANAEISLALRIENAMASYFRYLGKLFWPAHLSIIYPHPAAPYAAAERWAAWQTWLAALALIAISIGCIFLLRRKPYFAVGWFWFLGTLVPVIGLVQVGEQAMADRYTYIPLIGPVISLVWLTAELWKPGASRNLVLGLGTAALVLVCVFMTRQQLHYWKNTVTLFQHAVAVTSNNPSAEFSLGVGFDRQGELEKADFHYRRALQLNPLDAQAHYNRAQLLRKKSQWPEAALEYEAALRSDPKNVPALLNLATVLTRQQKGSEAASVFEQALLIEPDSIEGLNNLAWILATSSSPALRDGTRAVRLAERACALTNYKQATMIGTLAAAYAEAGRFPEAVSMAEKACAVASTSGHQEVTEKNAELLKLYRAGQPYHEAHDDNVPK